MFHDLNIPWTPTSPDLPRTIAFLDELGYNVVALNHTISGKFSQSHVNPISPDPFPQHPRLKILRRVTVVLDDPAQCHHLTSLVNYYDLVALRPTNDKLLLQACSSLECDLISIDLSQRLSYNLKHKIVGTAIQRGVFLEICYSASIHDVAARRNLMQNAASLIRATRGRGIIISSEARKAVGVRAPFDVMNLATLWGLSQEKGREAVGGLSRTVVIQAGLKRRSFRGVIDIVDNGALPETVQQKNKRKAEDENNDGKGKGKPAKGQQKQPQKQNERQGGQQLSKRAKKAAARAAATTGVS
ncbi:uncharacterized protein LAJ45_04497 [Morchella importuna]|uniref:PHP domain-like protein n=1 Tax=Morchella conica CCBAS932 TaxID=1392247 RepID=A0A3N4KUZ4_9PEZI|nr:uncharacterized protein LAJ45_04497 [Morchella importuna]KAH8151295.1 hypothetical protein LAJ45_04497 [Morchella importuna]RPB14347.1 PHP domain-like protein [Morchella conica CCBAS932]